jgi:hypothetical protein
MTDYGLDFALINTVDSFGNPIIDVDLTTVEDNDPRVVQTSDIAKIFANQGDYDWAPDQLCGAGLLDMKGKSFTNKAASDKRILINNMSLSDSRISSAFTNLSIQIDGSVNLTHKIKVNSGAVFVSDITINGADINTVLGSK